MLSPCPSSLCTCCSAYNPSSGDWAAHAPTKPDQPVTRTVIASDKHHRVVLCGWAPGHSRCVVPKPHTTHYLHPTHCTLHTAHYTLHTTHYTLHTTHYTLHTIQLPPTLSSTVLTLHCSLLVPSSPHTLPPPSFPLPSLVSELLAEKEANPGLNACAGSGRATGPAPLARIATSSAGSSSPGSPSASASASPPCFSPCSAAAGSSTTPTAPPSPPGMQGLFGLAPLRLKRPSGPVRATGEWFTPIVGSLTEGLDGGEPEGSGCDADPGSSGYEGASCHVSRVIQPRQVVALSGSCARGTRMGVVPSHPGALAVRSLNASNDDVHRCLTPASSLFSAALCM